MGIQNIEKYSGFYNTLKVWVGFWHNKVFYRKVEILNADRIPKKGHLIFTPNHQNALMDALAVLCTIDRRAVFLARSDIFKKPAISTILYFLKILPIYRIRDGYESLKKNKEIFKKTTDVITNEKCALVILPEGNHAGFRRLRLLKKGFARIAFQTEAANNYDINIQIVPVGIDYEDYQEFRSKLVINFGNPIPVSNYYKAHKENPASAINKIKDDLASKIKSLIINIETEEYYDLFNYVRVLYKNESNDPQKQTLHFQQQVVNQLQNSLKQEPHKIRELDDKLSSYRQKLKELKLGEFDQIIKKPALALFMNSMMLLTFLPLFIYGVVNNILPLKVTKFAESKIKDPQFKSSFAFVVSLLVFPIFSILQTAFIMVFVSGWYWILAYFVSIPLSGIFAWYYSDCLKKHIKDWRIYRLFNNKNDKIRNLLEDYQTIIQSLTVLIGK